MASRRELHALQMLGCGVLAEPNSPKRLAVRQPSSSKQFNSGPLYQLVFGEFRP